jgi:transcriptional regulator with XRE-family HTH domain
LYHGENIDKPQTGGVMSDFSNKLREYRERLGMKQRVLADRVGLTNGHLNKIEKGTRKPPGVETILSMMAVLRLSRSEAEELIQLAGFSPLALPEDEGLGYDTPLEPTRETPPPRQRMRGALGSPPPAPTLGRRIDAILEEEGLSREDRERLATFLIPHTKELAQFIKLVSGEENDAER